MQENPQPSLIATLQPSGEQRRAATALAVLLVIVFFITLSLAQTQLARLDVFIPLIATVMFLTDSITATLLYAQFSVLRSRALLVLAGGYLFTALTIVPYALTFPGAFAPMGLLGGGRQAPPWFNTLWHVGLPVAIIAYTLLSRRDGGVGVSVRTAIVACVGGVVALVGGLTWMITSHEELLPVLLVNDIQAADRIVKIIAGVFVSLSCGALILLSIRPRSILDLGLRVVSLAWLLGALLFAYIQTRYTVAWYMMRIFEVVASSFVLVLLLAESTILYARLSLSVLAQRREREGRIMSLDAMSAAIAHEVRQPLSAIMMNAHAGVLLLDKETPDFVEARNAFEEIGSDSQRVDEALQSVRAIFRVGERHRKDLDINALIREAVGLVKGDLVTAGIAVELVLADGLPRVSAHREQLQQVILNLIRNASEAMSANVGGRPRVLRVKSGLHSGGVQFSVEDSGVGIEPGQSERIFDAFFTTKKNGMGMGLAICRSVVESHGGTLTASPGESFGSILRVVLPVRDGSGQEPANPP